MVIISKYSHNIEYNLKTTLDASGLTKLQHELSGVSSKLKQLANQEIIKDSERDKALKTVRTIQNALTKSFNPKVGMLDISGFEKNLKGLPLAQIQKDFALIGSSGNIAFNSLVASLGKVDVGIKSASNSLTKMKNTVFNTVRWGIVSSAFNQMTNAIYDSVQYMQDLDKSLTNIMMVTDYSRDNMRDFAKEANTAAKALGSTTVEMTNASLIFAQQGFNLDQSSQLAEISTKLANASGQTTAETSDQITAYMNAYNIENDMQAIQKAMDSWAEVANVSAADVEELATASKKAASTANTVGVSMDQLNGQIAAIESVTREAPEQIGNGLKTLYARFSDLETGKTLEDGVSLGKVTEELESIGVEVLRGDGTVRNVGDIMEDLMDVWSSLDQTQKSAVASTVAGTYQLSRFEALMNRSDLYDQYKTASEDASGTLDVMNEKYVDSLQGKINKVQTSLEKVFTAAFNTDDLYGFLDILSEIIDKLGVFTEALGGGFTIINGLGAAALKIFSKDIGENLSNFASNMWGSHLKQDNKAATQNVLDSLGLGDIDKSAIEQTVSVIENGLSRVNYMTDNQLKEYNKVLDETAKAEIKVEELKARQKASVDATTLAYSAVGVPDIIPDMDKNGFVNTSGLEEQLRAQTELAPEAVKNMDWSSMGNALSKAQEQLETVKGSLINFKRAEENAIAPGDDLVDTMVMLEQALAKVDRAADGATAGRFGEIKEASEILRTDILENVPTGRVQEIESTLDKLKTNLIELSKTTREIEQTGGKVSGAEDFNQRNNELEIYIGNVENATALNEKFFKGLDFSIGTQEIFNMASAVQQLLFTWQAFQGLGSLWSDEDLSFGDKLFGTITNLATVVMNLVSAYQSFKEISQIVSAASLQAQLNQQKETKHIQEQTAALYENTAAIRKNSQAKQDAINTDSASSLKKEQEEWQPLEMEEPFDVLPKEEPRDIDPTLRYPRQKSRKHHRKSRRHYRKMSKAERARSFDSPREHEERIVESHNQSTPRQDTAVLAEQAKRNERRRAINSFMDRYGTSESTIKTKESASPWKAQTKQVLSATNKTKQIVSSTMKASSEAVDKFGQVIVNGPAKAMTFLSSKFTKLIGLIGKFAGPLAAIGAAISVAGAIKGYFDEKEAARVEAIQIKAKEASETLKNIKANKETFDTLYEGYKKGEVSSSELKESANALNDTLNDQLLITQALSENWDKYSEGIDKTAQKQAEASQNDLKNASWEAERAYVKSAGISDNFYFAKNAKADFRNNKILETAYESQSAISKAWDGSWGVVDGSTAAERIQAFNDMNDAYVKAIDEASGELKDTLQAQYDKFSAFAAKFNEEKARVEDSWKTEAEGALTAYGNNENFQYKQGESLEEYKQKLLETGKFSSEGAVQYFVDGMMAGDFSSSNDLANKIGADSATDAFGSIASDAVHRDLDNGTIKLDNSFGLLSGFKEDNFKKSLDEEFNTLDDEQKIELVGTLDKNATTQEILQKIQEIKEAPELSEAELAFKPNLTNRVDLDESQYSQVAKDVGISDATFNRLASDTYNQKDGYFQKESSKIEDQIAGIKDGSLDFKDVVDGAEDADEAIDALKEDYKDLAKEAKDVTAANLRMNKGVDSLIDSWDDVSKILKNDLAKGTADWYKAVDQVDGAISDILNIDVGTLSNDFYENADAVAAMEKAAKGDMAALDDLRNLATQDIIQNMDISIGKDGTGAEEARQELLSIQQELQNELANTPLEVRADVDLTEYVNKLNQMIKNGQITAEQASQVLSSMGVSGELETKHGLAKVPVTTYTMEYSETDPLTGLPTKIVQQANTEYKEMETDYSVFKGAHYIGAGVTGGVGSGGTKKPSGKGGGGGGKGGGGGGKAYKPKENKDPIKNKVDRYEKVNTALAAIGADYERIADEQDRLSGDKLFDNLQKQNDLIKKQIALHEEKLQIQKAELAEVQNQLQSDFGITFDSDGLMQNYAQVHQALIDEVNRLNSQYSSVTSEAEEKALDAKVEAAEKRLSNFEELYQRYDGLLSSDLKDTIKRIEDLKDALEDLHIQAIRMTFEIAGNIKEINEAVSVILTPKEVWFDENPLEKAKHLIGDIDKFFDDPTANDEYYDKQIKAKEEELSKTTNETRKKRLEQDIANLKESKEQQGKGTIDKAGSGYIDMLFGNADFSLQEIEEYKATGKSSVYGENGAALYEDALKNLTALASGIEELRSKVAELRATVDEAVSDAIEKCDELNHKYELINEDLEHQRDLVELVYGEKSFKEQRALIDAQIANNKAQIASQKRIIEEKKAMLATLDKDSEAYKNLKQSIEESESAVKNLTTSTVELQREAQKLATEEAISAMEKNFLGTDLEWAQTQWELINKQADMYLDDVNKAYNIQKLQNKYLNMLEKSNDLDIQQQITAQMDEQLGKLREKTKLSEYDVQYANAQLDILQKKIALEEAQRNKSEMKLRRDSQGNYSYVYTANDADLSAAQDSLLDAENNAYNMSKEHMIQMNNEKYAALQDFFEKFRQIKNDITLSEEERTKRLQELQDANKEILNAISEQLGVSQENMLKDFSDITGLILEENAGNLNDINEAIVNGNKDAMDQLDQRWTQSLDKIGKFGDAFSEKNKEVIEGLNTTLKGYETNVDEVASSVSGGFDTITESIKESQEATSNLNTETNALVESLQKTTGEIDKTQEKINGYITEIKLGNEKIEGLENTVKRLQAELLEEQRKRLLAEQAAANGNSSAAGGAGGGGGSATSNNGNAEIGDAVTYNGGAFWYRSNPLSGDPHGTTSAGSTVYITNINPNGKYPYHISRGPHLGSGDLGWLSLSQLSGYDTGGYTGSWGENTFDNKNGKLAVLHQKELVLNATDTANILTAVSAVRDMAQIFKMNSLEGIASSISNSLNNYQTIPQLGQDVNQNVHITAEFPNVSSSAEIEQALLTLNDRAMQYAFKNR